MTAERVEELWDYAESGKGSYEAAGMLRELALSLVEENNKLREGLKPFAAVRFLPDTAPDHGTLPAWMDDDETMPTVGDCRRAAELLKLPS